MPTKKQPTRAAGEQQPAKMDYWQIDRLAHRLAFELVEAPDTAKLIMLLMDEITKHPFDDSHIESLARTVNMRLFTFTHESSDAFGEFIASERKQLVGGRGRQ